MPGFDRRGPLGEGPRTGRRRGKCGKAKGASRLDVARGLVTRLGGTGAGRGDKRSGGRGRGRT